MRTLPLFSSVAQTPSGLFGADTGAAATGAGAGATGAGAMAATAGAGAGEAGVAGDSVERRSNRCRDRSDRSDRGCYAVRRTLATGATGCGAGRRVAAATGAGAVCAGAG